MAKTNMEWDDGAPTLTINVTYDIKKLKQLLEGNWVKLDEVTAKTLHEVGHAMLAEDLIADGVLPESEIEILINFAETMRNDDPALENVAKKVSAWLTWAVNHKTQIASERQRADKWETRVRELEELLGTVEFLASAPQEIAAAETRAVEAETYMLAVDAKLAAATEAAAVAALTSGEFQARLVAAQKQLAQVEEYARYYHGVESKKALFPRDAAPLSFAEWYRQYLVGKQP